MHLINFFVHVYLYQHNYYMINNINEGYKTISQIMSCFEHNFKYLSSTRLNMGMLICTFFDLSSCVNMKFVILIFFNVLYEMKLEKKDIFSTHV